jgi:hypothetical protein
MKLIGRVTGIDQRVAKVRRSDDWDEKRGFAIQVRPATPNDCAVEHPRLYTHHIDQRGIVK